MSSIRLNKNINIIYLLAFFNELFFPITAWLFFYLRYLDFPQIAILTGISGLASNLLEIPTGAFADIVGRKKAILLSYVFFSVAMFGIAFSTSFWAFLFFALVNSLCNSLFSGSLEALAYDSLKEKSKEQEFDKVVTKIEAFTWIGLFIGAISGGFMYQYWFRLPYIAQGVIAGIATVLSIGLYEPSVDSQKYNFKLFVIQNISGFKELFSNIKISQASIIFIILGSSYFIASSILGISQLNEYGMDASKVGLVFGFGYIIAASASFIYPSIRNSYSPKILLICVSLVLIGSFLLAANAGIVLGSLLIIGRIASSTTFRNTRSIVLNKWISSKNRATSLSTMVLLSQLPYAVFAYPIGKYIEMYSPNSFAFVLGVSIILLLVLQFLVFKFFFTGNKKYLFV